MSGLEIERKFLVVDDSYKSMDTSSVLLKQGYICSDRGRTVRVRTSGRCGFLTIKGPSLDGGLSRYEFEKEISIDEAEQLFQLCEEGVIVKHRHIVPVGSHNYEVDEFHGENEGLVVAEVELGAVDEDFDKPSFLGEEVTGDRRYYNSMLIKRPFSTWD